MLKTIKKIKAIKLQIIRKIID